MNHQIDQLKEEITSKEQSLVKEHLDKQRVEKEKDNLKVNLTRIARQLCFPHNSRDEKILCQILGRAAENETDGCREEGVYRCTGSRGKKTPKDYF